MPLSSCAPYMLTCYFESLRARAVTEVKPCCAVQRRDAQNKSRYAIMQLRGSRHRRRVLTSAPRQATLPASHHQSLPPCTALPCPEPWPPPAMDQTPLSPAAMPLLPSLQAIWLACRACPACRGWPGNTTSKRCSNAQDALAMPGWAGLVRNGLRVPVV